MRQRDGFGQFLISDEPYTPPESHWSYYYSHGTLAAAGAVAGVSVELPDGVAYRNVGEPGVTYSEEPLLLSRQWVQLRQDGRPLFNSIVSDVPHVWMSEGATMVIECASQTFHPGGEIALNQPVAKYRFESHITVGFLPRFPSNDGYYQGGYWLDSDVAIAPDGLRADVQFSNSVFQTSYPMKAALEHRNMRLSYRQGRIQPGESSFTDARVRMAVYDSGCGTSECPDSPGAQKVPISIAFDSPGHFNEDGSILIDSAVSEPFSPNFNTFTLVPVNHAVWYQPGTIIPDEISTRGGTRIAEHLQAMRKRDAPLHYSMNDPEFYRGSGLFSGLNIMSDELTGKRFNVQISVSDIDLLHSEHSKLYIRPAGYTGVMHAQNAATTFHINPDPECGGEGYAISMTSFGQAYVDNDSSGYDSTIDGTITIEWPSFIRIPFTGMNLDACGQFTTGEVPPDVQRETKQLAYWQADMQVLAIVFQNRVEGGQGCDQNPDDKTLIVISLHSIPHVRDPVMMAIDIRPCGTLRVSKNLMELSTEYDGYPVSLEKLYLSRWDGSPHPKANGFYTIIGDIDVPVFNSPKYQAIIQGENTWLATGDPWKNDAEPDSNGDGFIDRFDSAQFDDVTERLNGYADRYPVQGRTEFANFMPLRYDLHYNPGTRRFRTLEPNRQDLFILDIISAVEYLDRDRTEISFGVDADPMPDLNLSSLAARYGPFSDQIQNLFAETIQRPLDGLSDILSGDITFRVRAQITEDIQARFAVEFSAALRTEFQNHRNDWDNYVQSIDFTNFLQDQIDRFMRQLDLTAYLTSPTQPMVGEITAILTQVESLSQVLKFEDDELGRLTEALLLFAQHGLSAAFDINLNGIMDPIETVRSEVIAFLDNELIPAIEALDDFYGNPLTFLLNDNPRLSEGFFLPANVRQSEDRIKQVLLENLERLGQNAPTQLINIQPGFTADLFVNAFFNTEMVQRVSIKLGQDFRPIKDKLTNQTQRILDAINEQIESVLEEATGYVEGVVADFKNVTGFGGASLKGYARINRDFMERLHIDGEFSISAPDQVTYEAMLDIYQNKIGPDDSFCGGELDGGLVTDIQIEGRNIGLDFAGVDLRADVGVYLMLLDSRLVNVGGKLEVPEGSIDFEAFEIVEPGFRIAIGEIENYLAATAFVIFEDSHLGGGFFFGKSCTLAPLEMVDPQVAELLEEGPIYGIYAGAEGGFPILNYGCGLRVNAEAGVAMWYFADRNTYGGKLMAGVYGRAACVVNVKGQMTLIGTKDAGDYIFHGNTWIAGGVGWCETGRWSSPRRALRDDWCMACVVNFDLLYRNGWSMEYEVDCG